MASSAKADWLIPAGLIALSFIPIAAGSTRIVQLSVSVEVTPFNARFFASPLPVVLHILSSTIYCVLGAFQFSPSFRRRKPDWHRSAGRILVPCGLVAAISGLWMTHFYPTGIEPPASFDGSFLYVVRLLVGSSMVLFLCLGLAAVQKCDFLRHRVWMIRAYALGLGAGSQVFTHIPWFMFPSIHEELARTVSMSAGWFINLVVAEWLISREPRKKLQPR